MIIFVLSYVYMKLLIVLLSLAAISVLVLIQGSNESEVLPDSTSDSVIELEEEIQRVAQVPDTVEDTPNTSAGNSSGLNLSGQNLTKVPEYVFKETNLTSLNLADNSLTGALQAEVRHLQKLESLDLSGNQFTGVPAEVGQLRNLKVLNLANNDLTGLPHEIGNLKKLEVLDLRGNNPSEYDLTLIKESLPTAQVLVD